MKQSRNIIILIIVFLVGFGLGMLTENLINKSEPTEESIIIPDSLVRQENLKIDSFNDVERIERMRFEILQDSIRTIESFRYIKIDSIKNLPVDSGILYLRSKLK
jgi:hypothetical protein